MLTILDILRRNPAALALGALLIAAVAFAGWKSVQVRALTAQLERAHASLAGMQSERDQLRAIVRRNNSAVQALRFEREALDADFVALREQIEAEDYADCLDAVNRALGQ